MTEKRPNYYLLLDLAPDVEDDAVIERTIQEKKRRWSMDMLGNVAARRRAEIYLHQIDDIRRVMLDAQARRQEAANAVLLLRQQQQARLAEADKMIAVLRAKGACTREDVAAMVAKLGGGVTEQDVLGRLQAAGMPVSGDQPDPAATARPRLDTARLDQIRPDLALLHVNDLYAFLELNANTSAPHLWRRADQINREILRIGRIDSESTARKSLCGACLAIFGSEEEKAAYDNALGVEEMEAMRPMIEIAGGRDGFLSIEVQDALVQEARQRGVASEEARAYLAQYAGKRKWRLQSAARLPSDDMRQCGYCWRLVQSPNATHCGGCGKPLAISCPRCGTDMPRTNTACAGCGARVGDEALFTALLGEGRRLVEKGSFAEGIAAIDRALECWPNWAPAVQARRSAVERSDARLAKMQQIEALAAQGMLVGASEAVEALQRDYGPAGTETLRQRIGERLERAQVLERDGDALRRAARDEDALEKYEQALAIAGDLAGPRDALSSQPPPAPSGLTATPLATGYRLRWQAVSSRGNVRYHVLRQVDRAPQHSDDGIVISAAADTQADDATAPTGKTIYYAIYTKRGPATSRRGATVGPLIVTAEIIAAQVTAGNGEVTLTWRSPPGCVRVEVWRRIGKSPAGRGDGERRAIAGNGLVDGGLRNGERYGYRILAVYADPARPNQELFTAGVELVATPAQPPAPVEDLRARRHEGTVLLSWTPPPRGSVQVRHTTRMPDEAPGTVVPLASIDRFGTPLSSQQAGGAIWTVDRQGVAIFVPLTLGDGGAVLGRPVQVATVDDVTGLQARANGRAIMLNWTWPTGAEEAVVCHAGDGYPGRPDQAGATCLKVTRAAYQRGNGVEIRTERAERCYITVFVRAAGAGLYSAGAQIFEAMGQETVVPYCLRRKKAVISRTVTEAWVELTCAERITLPAMVVMGKPGRQPLTASDGVLLATVPRLAFTDGIARIVIPLARTQPNMHIKLFFEDGSNARQIRLMPASVNDMRFD